MRVARAWISLLLVFSAQAAVAQNWRLVFIEAAIEGRNSASPERRDRL